MNDHLDRDGHVKYRAEVGDSNMHVAGTWFIARAGAPWTTEECYPGGLASAIPSTAIYSMAEGTFKLLSFTTLAVGPANHDSSRWCTSDGSMHHCNRATLSFSISRFVAFL